jgi:hypothetical protein
LRTSDERRIEMSAENNTTTENGWPSTTLEAGDLQSYRSLIDSIHLFEWMALKLYMSEQTVVARDARARDIQEQLLAMKEAFEIDGCPPGYKPVGGKCVPISLSS